MNSTEEPSTSSGSKTNKGRKRGGLFSSRRNRNDSNRNTTNSSNNATNRNFLNKFEKRQWKDIRKRLRSRKGPQFVRATGCYGITILALALGHNAPLDIIEVILELDPSLALQKDVLGASPLHIACLNGAPLNSIQLLINKYPCLVTLRDDDLRTPLHHAVEFVCRLETQSEFDAVGFAVIQALVDVSPEPIHWEDKDGDSPIDLTHVVMIETDSSSYTDDESIYARVDELFQFLRKKSTAFYLEKKKKWEEEGYDVYAKVPIQTESTNNTANSHTVVTASTTAETSNHD